MPSAQSNKPAQLTSKGVLGVGWLQLDYSDGNHDHGGENLFARASNALLASVYRAHPARLQVSRVA